jgi:hypothetical protein
MDRRLETHRSLWACQCAVARSAQERSEVVKANDHWPVSDAGGALSIESEDAEAKIPVGCSIIQLAQQRRKIQSSSGLDFDIQPRHSSDVRSGATGPDWFGIWPPIGGEV